MVTLSIRHMVAVFQILFVAFLQVTYSKTKHRSRLVHGVKWQISVRESTERSIIRSVRVVGVESVLTREEVSVSDCAVLQPTLASAAVHRPACCCLVCLCHTVCVCEERTASCCFWGRRNLLIKNLANLFSRTFSSLLFITSFEE